MNAYEQRLEEKRERLEEAAARARARSAAIFTSAHERASMIPMGQPILVGHHSEKRDRNFRGKIQRGFERANEEAERAKELEQRAASVGTGGISSDDPEAVEKIGGRVEELEAKRDRMKAVNKAFKKVPGDKAAKLAGLVKDGILTQAEALEHARTFAVCPYLDLPFPSFTLTNLGANIRRLKQRSEHLAEPDPEKPDIVGQGWRIIDNVELNRTQIAFDKIPVEALRAELKSNGFHWSPTEKRWQRHRSSGARYWAQSICERHLLPVAPAPVTLVITTFKGGGVTTTEEIALP